MVCIVSSAKESKSGRKSASDLCVMKQGSPEANALTHLELLLALIIEIIPMFLLFLMLNNNSL